MYSKGFDWLASSGRATREESRRREEKETKDKTKNTSKKRRRRGDEGKEVEGRERGAIVPSFRVYGKECMLVKRVCVSDRSLE